MTDTAAGGGFSPDADRDQRHRGPADLLGVLSGWKPRSLPFARACTRSSSGQPARRGGQRLRLHMERVIGAICSATTS
jgi:hypothetical protein